MTKLLNIEQINQFLTDFVSDNSLSLAFLATPEGGMLSCNDFSKGRLVVEALSTVWQTFPVPKWERINFEWDSSLCIVVNLDKYVFGITQCDPNPSTIGLLRLKACVVGDYFKKILSE
jgi:hypothetical protein